MTVVLAGSDDNACGFADGRGARFGERPGCRETWERRGSGEGLAVGGSCSSAAVVAGLGALKASTVGMAVITGDPSAMGDDTAVSRGLDALDGADAEALGARTAAEALAAGVDVSDAAGVIGVEGCGAAVSSAK